MWLPCAIFVIILSLELSYSLGFTYHRNCVFWLYIKFFGRKSAEKRNNKRMICWQNKASALSFQSIFFNFHRFLTNFATKRPILVKMGIYYRNLIFTFCSVGIWQEQKLNVTDSKVKYQCKMFCESGEDLARTRSLFLRIVSLCYAIAFSSLYPQISGLYGPKGLLPVHTLLGKKIITLHTASHNDISYASYKCFRHNSCSDQK